MLQSLCFHPVILHSGEVLAGHKLLMSVGNVDLCKVISPLILQIITCTPGAESVEVAACIFAAHLGVVNVSCNPCILGIGVLPWGLGSAAVH